MSDTLELQVPKGTKVRIKEVDAIKDADPRIPADRNVLLTTAHDVKIAIKKTEPGAGGVAAKASVITMCG